MTANPNAHDDAQTAPEAAHDDTAATSMDAAVAEQHPDDDPATPRRRSRHFALVVVHTLWNTVTIVALHVVAIGILEKTPLLALLTLH